MKTRLTVVLVSLLAGVTGFVLGTQSLTLFDGTDAAPAMHYHLDRMNKFIQRQLLADSGPLDAVLARAIDSAMMEMDPALRGRIAFMGFASDESAWHEQDIESLESTAMFVVLRDHGRTSHVYYGITFDGRFLSLDANPAGRFLLFRSP